MKIKAVLFFASAFILILFACKHEPFAPPTSPIANNPGLNPVPTDSVSFQTEVLPIFQSNCAMNGCHAQVNPQKGIRLNSYDNIMNSDVVEPGRPERSELVEMIEENDEEDRMPPLPASRLSQAQIALIRKWISEGARNTNIVRCDTSNISFAAVNNIITSSCKGCHGSANPSAGISLVDYSSVKEEAQNGNLLCAIEHLPGCTAMPYGGSKLESCKLIIIKKWAASGYPQ